MRFFINWVAQRVVDLILASPSLVEKMAQSIPIAPSDGRKAEVHKGSITPIIVPNKNAPDEYELISYTKLSQFSAMVDLSSMRPGDVVEIRVYVMSQGEFRRYKRIQLEGQQDDPVLSFSWGLVRGAKVTLRQTAGRSSKFYYEAYAIPVEMEVNRG